MADFKVDKCDSCGAKVIWSVTVRARNMPVDADPIKGGNVQLEHRGAGVTPLARVLTPAQQFGRTNLHRSHFVSCPQAASWRKRGGGGRA